MYDIFHTRKINYNFRSQTDFDSIWVNTNKFGLNSLRYFALKVWSIVHQKLKILEVSKYSKILGPKKVKVSVPLHTVLTLFLLNLVVFFKLKRGYGLLCIVEKIILFSLRIYYFHLSDFIIRRALIRNNNSIFQLKSNFP